MVYVCRFTDIKCCGFARVRGKRQFTEYTTTFLVVESKSREPLIVTESVTESVTEAVTESVDSDCVKLNLWFCNWSSPLSSAGLFCCHGRQTFIRDLPWTIYTVVLFPWLPV